MDNSSSEGNSQPKRYSIAKDISQANVVNEIIDNEVFVFLYLFDCFALKILIFRIFFLVKLTLKRYRIKTT